MCPDVDGLVVALIVGDEAHVVVAGHLIRLSLCGLDQLVLFGGDHHVGQVKAQSATEGVHEAEFLDIVQELGGFRGTAFAHHTANDVTQRTLGEHFVDVAHFLGDHFIEEHSAHSGLDKAGLAFGVHPAHFDPGVQVQPALVVGDVHFLGAVEDGPFPFDGMVLLALATFGDVIKAEHHVLTGHRDGRSVGRVEDVVAGQHQQLCFQDGGVAQWQVNGHLVTVKVSVEGGGHQRVQLDGLALDQFRLEGLDA